MVYWNVLSNADKHSVKRMNHTVVIGSVVLLILLVLGARYFWSPQPISFFTLNSERSSATASSSPSVNNSGAGVSGLPATQSSNTFHSIFTQSGSHACTYTRVDASSQSNDVIYIVGGKMRGEFRTLSGSTATANLMVYNGSYLYTWREGSSTGKKTLIRSVADLPQAIPRDLESGAILGSGTNNVGWDCHAWEKNSSLLVPPSYVRFSSSS